MTDTTAGTVPASDTASIAGKLFYDANGDGQIEAGDQGYPGFGITLENAAGQFVGTTVTDTDGDYQFSGLAAGTYTVTFPSFTGPFLNTLPNTAEATVMTGQSLPDVNGAFAAAAAIDGTVFGDLNGNGIRESGETGVNGVTVQLLDSNGNPIASTTTGVVAGFDGSYSFTGLKPGSYKVLFTAPTGDILTTPTSNLEQVTYGQAVEVDAGLADPASVIPPSVSGTAFVDTNGNGTKDTGEAGLSGVSVALIENAGTSSATAVATTVTDAEGNYVFTGIAPGTYSAVFSQPDGEAPTTSTTVPLGMLTTGNPVTASVGFKPSQTPASPGPFITAPSSAPTANTPLTLNIIIRGQSNAQNLSALNNLDTVKSLQSQIETLLGFNGTTQQVKVLEDYGKADGDNTIYSSTALIGNWLSPINGNYQNGWTANSYELGFLSDLSQDKATLESGPTAVVWLHNEADSLNGALTTPMWESAVQYEAGLVRGLLGQSVPYMFVNAIPYLGTGTSEQAIRVGMSQLADDPSFNGGIAAQSSDVAADYYVGTYNGGHLDLNDLQQLIHRLSLSLADTFSSYALPGSPLATAGGSVDDEGPQVIAATTVAGHANQLLLTVKQDQATSLEPLGAAAQIGTGWSIRNNAAASNSTLEASGTAAQIVDGTHLLVTFDSAVPVGGDLFYGWGSGLIAPSGQTGIGAAVYDNNGLPIWTDGNGVAVTAPVVTAPTDQGGGGGGSVSSPSDPPLSVTPATVTPTVPSTPANNAVTRLPPPVAAFAPTVTMHGSTATLTGTASAASGATVASVDIVEGSTSLGPATLASDGTWSFAFDAAAGVHPGIAAIVTDSQGSTTTASSGFDLTTGVAGEPYATVLDRYDPSSAAYLGSAYFKAGGALYDESNSAARPDGGSTLTYSGGSFFKTEAYSSFADSYDAAGTLTQHVEDNRDGSHLIEIDANRQTVQTRGTDTLVDHALNTHFVFHHGVGEEAIYGFRVSGPGHDTLSLPGSDADRLAQILAGARGDGQGDTVLTLGHGDTVTLYGVLKADLKAHPGDFAFHA